MNFKKKALLFALPLTLASIFNAAAADDPAPITVNGGTVNFEGSIVNAPCVVEVGSDNSVVTMGQHRMSNFKATGDTSNPVGFDIKLSDCAVDTYSNASITFSGNTLGGNDNVLALNSASGVDAAAEGIGLQILQDGTPVKVDGTTPSASTALKEGDTNIHFNAQYISVADKVTSGSANTSAQFTVKYQ